MIYHYGQYNLHMWILNMVLKYINLLQSHQPPILVCMHVIFWGRPKTCLFPLVFIRFVRFALGWDGEDMRVIIISEYHIRIGRRILRDLILWITINHTLFTILREMSFLLYACHNPTYNRNISDIRFPQLIESIYHRKGAKCWMKYKVIINFHEVMY